MQGARQRIQACLKRRTARTRVHHLVMAGEKYFTKPGSEGFNGGMEHYPVILLDDIMKNVKEAERHEPEQEYPVCRSGLHLRQREGCLPDGVVLGGGAVAQHGSGESLTAFPM